MIDRDEDVGAVDKAITQLRLAYEKYFAGIERIEPLRERDETKKMLHRAQAVQSANTARRFRLQQAQARLVTLEQYWNRVARQIEEGTYKRDRLRVQRRLQASADAPAAPAAPPTAAKAAPSPADKALERLHTDYVAARQKLGAPSVTIEQLAATVAKQKAAIKQRYQCRDVEFRVAVKEGRAILKAIPKK